MSANPINKAINISIPVTPVLSFRFILPFLVFYCDFTESISAFGIFPYDTQSYSVGHGDFQRSISHGLDYFTTYNWFVNVTDGTHWSNETFSFRTTTENTVVIEPTDDATISDPDDNVNFGTSEALRLRSIGGGWDLEALIKFNLTSIPSNVTIVIAGLKAFYYRYEEDDPKRNKVNLYRNKKDWDEETVTWNNKPSHVTEPSTFARIPEMINNWIFWNVTGDAQMFYNNSTINYGWTIQDMSGTWQNEEPYFRSKEYIEYHPHLIIGYE